MRRTIALAAAVLAATTLGAAAQDTTMSFFVTSQGPGNGANLGGLAGADAYCQKLAEAAGVTGPKTWRAYLSTDEINAKDRIGSGPWYNAKGKKIADDVAALHGDKNGIAKDTALDEKGNVINGRGDTPNRHDILTGSLPDGTKAPQTCNNWTSAGDGAAFVGHHDRKGLDDSAAAHSWNSSHPTQGCSQEALRKTGGDGLLYCFAAE